jgi:alpha-N-acetylglucosaminidase
MKQPFDFLTTIVLLLVLNACQSSPSSTDAIGQLAHRVMGVKANTVQFRTLPSRIQGTDYFNIRRTDGTVCITGNNTLSQATGLNWYLKYGADKETMHECTLPERYYLNYCTYSYSMPFWDWKRWEQEIDRMAMHGINMPLSITGIEVVWRNLLRRLGYNDKEIGAFISGPAYFAWWQMNNLEGWGGPLPDDWYTRQEALEKKIVARMRSLGMEPVFPGYAGMVPRNIGEKLGYTVADPGKWCGFNRPAFLSPEDPHFAEVAAMYYEELEKLYGKSRYYSMDPFHEGGNTGGVNLAEAGQAIMKAMKKANPKAVWVVQAWQDNPKQAMIDTLNQGDLLVLDLYSEKTPQWGDPHFKNARKDGFGKHDWLYCMLLNFGGNVGLHGRMNQLVNGFYDARSNPNGQHLRGVGATPEGIGNNPLMYELLYELPWREERFSPDDWLKDYLKGRYGGGALAPEVLEAWRALEHTVYNAPLDYEGQGTVESLFCARPGFHLTKTSTWGCAKLFYSPDSTLKAAMLMDKARQRYGDNDNFRYDLVDIARQAITDQGNILLDSISNSYDRQDITTYKRQYERFLELILTQDKLLATHPEFRVSTWLDAARSCADNTEEVHQYVKNAAMLITVWGDSIAANVEGLHDYAHREWSGILKELYYQRWEAFFLQRLAVLEGKEAPKDINFYRMEQEWVDRQ